MSARAPDNLRSSNSPYRSHSSSLPFFLVFRFFFLGLSSVSLSSVRFGFSSAVYERRMRCKRRHAMRSSSSRSCRLLAHLPKTTDLLPTTLDGLTGLRLLSSSVIDCNSRKAIGQSDVVGSACGRGETDAVELQSRLSVCHMLRRSGCRLISDSPIAKLRELRTS